MHEGDGTGFGSDSNDTLGDGYGESLYGTDGDGTGTPNGFDDGGGLGDAWYGDGEGDGESTGIDADDTDILANPDTQDLESVLINRLVEFAP